LGRYDRLYQEKPRNKGKRILSPEREERLKVLRKDLDERMRNIQTC
jgi:hypothetical protein